MKITKVLEKIAITLLLLFTSALAAIAAFLLTTSLFKNLGRYEDTIFVVEGIVIFLLFTHIALRVVFKDE